MSDQLWAVHVEGPDSIIAQESEAAALKMAADINEAYEVFKRRAEASEFDARWHAEVIPWPYSAADHAEALSDFDGEIG